MAYQSLHEFIQRLDKAGELRRIQQQVDPYLEITEIADRVMKMPGGGPALLFENVKGSKFPLAINLMGSRKRMSWALGVDDIEEIADEIAALTRLPSNMPASLLGKIQILPQLAALGAIAPKLISPVTAPCQEVVKLGKDANLDELPILTCWPDDGGPFITLPLVFTKDEGTGKRNVGMYRIQKQGPHETGMHWQRHKVGSRHYANYEAKGRDIPVAIVLGGDPALTYAATAPLPDEIDEMVFAGFLRKKPVELVKCKTIDMEVPADADFVLEGYVAHSERRREGPFGDHTGYYSLADDYPVFRITAITHRRSAVYPCTIVGPPPMEDKYLGLATERLFLPLARLMVPEIIDYHLPSEGAFHNLALIRIKKRYPGHAFKVMHALWGLGQMMFTKCIVVVDEDVDVQNPGEVVWRAFANIDPERDITFVKGPIDVLDHASPLMAFGSKMGVDATRKWPDEGFTREWPEVLTMTPAIKQRVDAIWRSLGIEA
ncbi:menaquinone biosynthesis decarboxylase [Capsulimonas corticalis]|uniref:Phenolic acid decarboxylase n=1 Tax=Capsulimonas corticalis TaxID=2219043 RepID=A0A402D6G3_9BACT|nr:menaquinone biosynthesis decarboxylase [Capsulimonas corticalis]BDI32476.1 menaquinone biosynthesis decarboxylase [Capsulimonas corticalis]